MKNIDFNDFLENALILNNKFGIIPLLYGSLGLKIITDSKIKVNDIDILIPKEYVDGSKWIEFKRYLESIGYILVDEHEHTFRKNNIDFSYAKIENLEKFALIEDSKIQIFVDKNVKYKLLNLEQYLKVYEMSLLDEYRVNVLKKEQKDKEKILLIKEKLCKI